MQLQLHEQWDPETVVYQVPLSQNSLQPNPLVQQQRL